MAKPEAAAIKLRDEINAKFGEDSSMLAKDMPRRRAISSGSLALDFAIGIGGLPVDKFIEVHGTESTGKTTLGLLAMCNFLDAQPKRCAVILDTEHKLTPQWLETLVGTERLARVIYLQPDDVEQALAMYVKAVTSREVCFLLFDSIAAAETSKVIEDPEKGSFGAAKTLAQFSRIAGMLSSKYVCCTFAVNQTRDDLGGFHRIITPGGHAPKHHQILRIYIKKGKGEVFEEINGEKTRVGYVVMAKIIKNQLGGPEGRVCQWWIFTQPTERWGFGIDTTEEISRLALVTGVIERKGGWYYHPSLPGGKIQGADQFAAFVKVHDELRVELTREIMARIHDHAREVAPITDPDAPIRDEQVAPIFREEF